MRKIKVEDFTETRISSTLARKMCFSHARELECRALVFDGKVQYVVRYITLYTLTQKTIFCKTLAEAIKEYEAKEE